VVALFSHPFLNGVQEDFSAANRGIILSEFRKMRLTLLDRETGESRPFTLAEAKTWDWKDPEVWRMIGDWQITSYESLVHVLGLKLENGREEVVLLVAPRFTMLAGG
jgi:hypothetical protein